MRAMLGLHGLERGEGGMTGRPVTDPMERFMAMVWPEPNSGCWLWGGTVSKKTGHGRFRLGPPSFRNIPAYRFSYEAAKGPIPSELVVDHLCSNPYCVNPDHLEAVTIGDNVRRTIARGRWVNPAKGQNGHNTRKTHCPKGHPYGGENLIVNHRGSRVCRACRNFSARTQKRLKDNIGSERWRVM